MSVERRLQRDALARRAAAQLITTEEALDLALHHLGLLYADLPQLRREANVSAVVGQEIFDAVGAAVSAATATRQHLVTAHHAYSGVHGQLRLSAIPEAPGGDKPPNENVTARRAQAA